MSGLKLLTTSNATSATSADERGSIFTTEILRSPALTRENTPVPIIPIPIRTSLDLPAGAHVRDQCAQRVEADLGDVGVGLGLRVDPFLAVADGGVRHAHPAVEPWAAAEAAEHRNLNRAHHR